LKTVLLFPEIILFGVTVQRLFKAEMFYPLLKPGETSPFTPLPPLDAPLLMPYGASKVLSTARQKFEISRAFNDVSTVTNTRPDHSGHLLSAVNLVFAKF